METSNRHHLLGPRVSAFVALLVLAGCTDRATVAGDGGGDSSANPTRTVVERLSVHATPIDLLFVIDNTGSMLQEQAALAASVPTLLDSLASNLGGTLPSLHVGVTSTDLGIGSSSDIPGCEVAGGDRGLLQSSPRIAGCTPPADRWINHDLLGQTNVPQGADDPAARVAEAFSCISQLGRGGCAFEQPLEAARLALDPEIATNPGFLRDESVLAIVIVTNEDDCSAKNTDLFNPAGSLTDELGPFTDFRCFEHGFTCDINDRMVIGPRQDCAPSGEWLFDIADHVLQVDHGAGLSVDLDVDDLVAEQVT